MSTMSTDEALLTVRSLTQMDRILVRWIICLTSFYKLSVSTREFGKLQLFQIYFDTSTFDIVENDEKVTLEAQIGLVGGTLGLFAGFSILSGVEIIYHLVKYFFSIITSREKKGNKNLA